MDKRPHVIFLVIDAFCYNSLNRRVGPEWVAPYLKSLTKESLSFDNVFSLAPYTEASLVSLLGGDRTMENGGYFFGNAACEHTLLGRYEKEGYRTLLTYSPYVYSKAYLKGVSDFVYTRRYSIKPLFMYRLDVYSELKRRNCLIKDQILAVAVLLREALESWIEQIDHLCKGDDCVRLITREREDKESLISLKEELLRYLKELESDYEACVSRELDLGRSSRLIELSDRYIASEDLPLKQELLGEFQAKLAFHQARYSQCMKHDTLDFSYLFSTLRGGKDGWKNCIKLAARYIGRRRETSLSDYLYSLEGGSKVETSLSMELSYALRWLRDLDSSDAPGCVYLQPQDFHLPSVFHTVDSNNLSQVRDEMNDALRLLDAMPEDYSGNIIADLSAHYIDKKVQGFVSELDAMGKDYVLVITADHGYPCYDDPPRPYVYNQTYVEAFHIPFIVKSSRKVDLKMGNDLPVDNLSLLCELNKALLEGSGSLKGAGYVITEYGGPGCPDMTDKPLWYTYIDDAYRISVECKLSESFSDGCVKTIVNIKEDPDEKRNLAPYMSNLRDIDFRLARISERHTDLRSRYSLSSFWSTVTNPEIVHDDIAKLVE